MLAYSTATDLRIKLDSKRATRCAKEAWRSRRAQ